MNAPSRERSALELSLFTGGAYKQRIEIVRIQWSSAELVRYLSFHAFSPCCTSQLSDPRVAGSAAAYPAR